MKFIKKINEFFNSEEEIEREDNFAHDEEEGDFYFDEEEVGHDEEEGDFSHEEENWGDEEDSSLGGSSRISSFDDFGSEEECEPCGDEEEHYGHEEDHFGHEEDEDHFGHEEDEDHFGHEEDEDHFGHEEDHGDEEVEGDENAFVESFKSFNEKKKVNAGLQAYLDKKAGKKSKKSEEDEEEDEKSTKGKTPKTKKEKDFAALADPKDKITFADKIAGAKKSKKK